METDTANNISITIEVGGKIYKRAGYAPETGKPTPAFLQHHLDDLLRQLSDDILRDIKP